MKKLILLVCIFQITTIIEGQRLSVLKDINLGKGGSNPKFICQLPNGFFFNATDSATGNELWFSNGSRQNTYMVLDANKGTGGSQFMSPYIDGNYTIQIINNGREYQLWKSNGIVSETKLLKTLEGKGPNTGLNQFIRFKDKYYYQDYDSANGYELWVSDTDFINPHLFIDSKIMHNGYLFGLIAINDHFYFASNSIDSTGKTSTIFESDGTVSGTHIIIENNGTLHSVLHSLNDSLIFISSNESYSEVLYSYNFVTKTLSELYNDKNEQIVNDIFIIDNYLFFRITDNNLEINWIWVYNQNDHSLKKLTFSLPEISDARVLDLASIKGDLFFHVRTNISGKDLWRFNKDNYRLDYISNQDSNINFSVFNNGLSLFENKFYYLGYQFFSNFSLVSSDEMHEHVFELFKFESGAMLSNMIIYSGKFFIWGNLNNSYGEEIYKLEIPTSIINNTKSDIILFPNPVMAGETLTVNSLDKISSVRLYDLNGRAIDLNIEDNEIPIPQNLSAGIYTIQLFYENSIQTLKLIIK